MPKQPLTARYRGVARMGLAPSRPPRCPSGVSGGSDAQPVYDFEITMWSEKTVRSDRQYNSYSKSNTSHTPEVALTVRASSETEAVEKARSILGLVESDEETDKGYSWAKHVTVVIKHTTTKVTEVH